jgi:hypothetical protein
MSDPRRRGFILLAMVFVAGALAGIAGDRALVSRREAGTRVMLRSNDLLDQLDLSREQRVAAESILARSSPSSEAVMRELALRLSSIADSANRELASVLSPAQRAKLDSLITRGSLFLLKRKDALGRERVDTVRKR